MPQDKYDEAVAWLTEHPECIHMTWNTALTGHFDESNDGLTNEECIEAHKQASCLFLNCGKSGCLTEVAHKHEMASTPELTQAIRADRDNIPEDGKAIQVKDLPIFAKWRRRELKAEAEY